jgi:hypothetical protein
MKTFTWCLRALSGLALLAAPALANAQAWQWASAPTAIADPSNTSALGGSTTVGIALEANGNTVVVGSFYGSITLGSTTLTSAGYSDVFVARVSPGGQWLQAVQAGGAGEDIASSMVLDAAGNTVVAGRFGNLVLGASMTFGATMLTSAGNTDAFVAQLSPAGQWTQAVRAGGTGADQANKLVLDAAGNAVVAGSFTGSAVFGNTTLTADSPGSGASFVARLNLSTGAWAPMVPPTGSTWPSITALTLDAAGNMVVAGGFNGSFTAGSVTSAYASPIFVARMNSSGQWTQAVQAVPLPSNAPPSSIVAMTVDAAGTVTITGILIGSVTFGSTTLTSAGIYDIYVARLNAAGQWTQAVRAGGAYNEIVSSLTTDAAGNSVISGSFGPGTTVTVPPTAAFGNITLTSAGQYDAFVATLSPSGQWLQAIGAGGPGRDVAYGAISDAAGNITVTGVCSSPASFGANTLTNTSSYASVFVARLAATALAAHAAKPAEIFTLYPNPAASLVHVTWPETSTAARPMQIIDGLGREVRQQQLPAHTKEASLNVAELAPGLYTVRCGAAVCRLQVE